MNDQLALNLSPLVVPIQHKGLTIEERFNRFYAANPHVADAFEALAAQWLARHSKVGAKAIAEQLRWRSGIETQGEPWKINNSLVALYARLLLDRHPEWKGRIEIRERKAA